MFNKYLKIYLIIVVIIANVFSGFNFVVAATSQTSSLDKGLLAWFPLDRSTKQSATTFIDRSPNARIGTITAGSSAGLTTNQKGLKGGAYDFTSASSGSTLVDTGSDFIGVKAVTVSAWIYARTYGFAGDGKIINNGNFVLRFASSAPKLQFSSVGSGFATSADSSILLGTWYHVVLTRSAATTANTNFYINGVLSGTANQNSGTPTAGTGNVTISGDVRGFDGRIADVRFYNRILTATEIRNLYQSYGPAVQTNFLDKGLIAEFPLNKSTKQSVTTFVDTSPFNRTGTITAGVSAGLVTDQKGLAGGAYDFDAANTKIDTGSNWIGTNAVTISAWIYARSYGEGGTPRGRIVDNGGLILNLNVSGNANFGLSSDSGVGNYAVSVTNSIKLGQWYHVVGTRNSAGTANLYINGVLSGSANQFSGTPVAGGNVIIGNNSGQSATFDGRIADLRVYNRVLTTTEIRNLYKSYGPVVQTNSLDKGLIASFPLDRNTRQSASTYADTSPFNRTATLSAGASAVLRTNQKGLAGGAITPNCATNQTFSTGSDWIGMQPVTVSAWVKFSNYGNNNVGRILNNGAFSFGISGSTNQWFELNSANGAFGGAHSAVGSALINTWYNIVVTRSAAATANTNFYINGVLSGTSNQNSGAPTAGSNVNIGFIAGGNTVGMWCSNALSDIRVWNRILSNTEIKNLYQSTK